ncbi:MAG: hypothetical protein N3A60_12040, partial [Thermanaerothrix sp.]|nr:hypothetical protein [Thermanaerothrix sp.]
MVVSLRNKLITWVLIMSALAVWEAGVRFGNVPPYLLPAPSLILSTLIQNLSIYIEASWITFGEALLGLLIGTCVGTLIAILVTFWPGLEPV